MTALSVANPYPVILSLAGAGLNGGKVYIGQPNQDPQSFPQAVYWDSALTVPASQPLTVTGGYVTNSGTPAVPYVAGAYSIKVLNAQGVQVFYDALAIQPGEVVTSSVAIGSAVSLTDVIAANLTSISLTAGSWNIWGNFITLPAGGALTQSVEVSINTASVTQATPPNGGAYYKTLPRQTSNADAIAGPCGQKTLTLTATTTVYLVITVGYTGGTMKAYGSITARRAA